MLDLHSYMMYELLLSWKGEREEAKAVHVGNSRGVRFNFVAWTLASLGSTLVKSGRKLKDRYEPLVRTRPQTSN